MITGAAAKTSTARIARLLCVFKAVATAKIVGGRQMIKT